MPFPSETLGPASSSHLGSILDVALSDYKKITGKDLLTPRDELSELLGGLFRDPMRMPRLDPVDHILAELQGHVDTLEELKDGNRGSKLMKWISSLVHILYPLSAILGDGFGLVRFRSSVATNAHADIFVTGRRSPLRNQSLMESGFSSPFVSLLPSLFVRVFTPRF
jgi:hypothetical protein